MPELIKRAVEKYDMNCVWRLASNLQSVIDHETWVMDLAEANREGEPHWYRLYSARHAYGMHSLRPQEWDKLIHRLTHDDDLFDMYHR